MKEYSGKMRKEVIHKLFTLMKDNKDIIVLTGDLGFGLLDEIRDTYPERFINCGASEQAMSDIAVGLALSGKIPFMYTITSFYYRCWETLRTYIDHENLNVKMLASGRDTDYHVDGYSHHSEDMRKHLDCLPNIAQYFPETNEQALIDFDIMMSREQPCFLSLRK